ncbi:hypothetical protein QFW80_00580 [Luteimonas sp. M1R5S18]|uniref:Uncharacterized protein n=1 Tax=Luteimonas rhizosphaericola TaxID=3042024 RepID=A0ABT6JG55_9GAMM|nr:hypothetical protein [Luteimonas rhizosphaericola]MDH5829021.1 hypothetical protein [Luteimonas rhizosphaericola]
MKEIIASALPYLVFLAIAMAVLAYFVSERFFDALCKTTPEMADAFKRKHLLVSYGPIVPAKFRYINSRQFNSLADPEMRRKGRLAFAALVAYAATFLALLLALLAWAS